jgi:MFS family permease
MMVASTVTSFFLVRWGYRRPIIIGTVIVIVCLFLLALQPHGFNLGGADIGVMTLLFIVVGLLGIGAGVCTPAANNACIELMPDKVATITGLRGTFRTLGSSCGIAIATVVIHNTTDAGHAFFIKISAEYPPACWRDESGSP